MKYIRLRISVRTTVCSRTSACQLQLFTVSLIPSPPDSPSRFRFGTGHFPKETQNANQVKTQKEKLTGGWYSTDQLE